MSSCDVLLYPFCWATEEREDSAACDCASVTEMPLAAATWSQTSNLISQDSTAAGMFAGGQLRSAAVRLDDRLQVRHLGVQRGHGDPLVADDRRGA